MSSQSLQASKLIGSYHFSKTEEIYHISNNDLSVVVCNDKSTHRVSHSLPIITMLLRAAMFFESGELLCVFSEKCHPMVERNKQVEAIVHNFRMSFRLTRIKP